MKSANCDISGFIDCFSLQDTCGVSSGKNRVEKFFPFSKY